MTNSALMNKTFMVYVTKLINDQKKKE